MTDLFADERLQFFLRNREDIKAWAAIEPGVIAATRELLARSQPLIEERLLEVDPTALVDRRDGGPFERVFARHDQWPPTVGLALEWHRSVDPVGAARPKVGVFWWADPPTLIAPRTRFAQEVDAQRLQRLGYKVPLDGVWPILARPAADAGWWRDPEAWIAPIVDLIAATWPLVAPTIDEVIGVERPVSDG